MKFYPDIPEKIDHLKHYSLKRPLSFCVEWMYLIGGRRYGKTYSIKSFLLKDFVDNGNRFAWIRSWEPALENICSKEQFFGRMKNLKGLGVHEYNIRKRVIYINGKEAGYLFPISTFYNIKGADYDNVVNAVWDEFMRAKGERALPDKRRKFNDLIESVLRGGRKRVFCISNSTNQFDEVLQPFNVTLKDFGTYLYREKNALIHYIRSSKTHIDNMEDSASGHAMTESEKAFAFSNRFTDYGDYGALTKGRYVYSLQVDDDKFLSIYASLENGENRLYIRCSLPPSDMIKLKAIENRFVNSKVQKLSPMNVKLLRTLYNSGKIVFDNGYARDMFTEHIFSTN